LEQIDEGVVFLYNSNHIFSSSTYNPQHSRVSLDQHCYVISIYNSNHIFSSSTYNPQHSRVSLRCWCMIFSIECTLKSGFPKNDLLWRKIHKGWSSSFLTILFQIPRRVSWKKTLKKMKKKAKTRKRTVFHATGCMLRSSGCEKLHWRAPRCERARESRGKTVFCCFSLWVGGKIPVFHPKPTWKSTYKYISSHSQLFI